MIVRFVYQPLLRLTMKMSTRSRPSFADLPLRPNDPPASAWGLWGDEDELGTLNLLTPETVKRAGFEILSGETVPLRSVFAFPGH